MKEFNVMGVMIYRIKETDVILISDIVVEDIIREKFRKNHITIPCYSMTELL